MISEREPFSPLTGQALLMERREPSWRVGRASGLDETEVNFLLKDDEEDDDDFCLSLFSLLSLSLSVLFSETLEEMLQSSSCCVIKYFHSSEILKVTVETAPDDELVRSCCRYRRISPVALSSAAPMKDSKDDCCFDDDGVTAVMLMDSYNGVALYQETISTIDDGDDDDDNSETK